MNEPSLLASLHLDRASGVSLREQLQGQLYKFVKKAPAGTRIPPERLLQSFLHVSRVTIRSAILPLYRDGLLIRNRRQGTLVRRLTGAALENGEIQKMSIGSFSSHTGSVDSLSLLLYEDNVPQKDFWEYVVHFFNVTHRHLRIQIHWVPHSVDSSTYHQYLTRIKPDIFQYGEADTGSLFARPLSERLRQECLSGVFHSCEKLDPEKFCYAFSSMLSLWNESLARQYGIENIRERIRSGCYLDLFEEADRKLPQKYFVYGHVWDFFCFSLLEGQRSSGLKRSQVRQVLERLWRFRNSSRIFYNVNTDALAAVRHFGDGRQLFLDVHPSAWQACSSEARFKVGYEPFGIPRNGIRKIYPLYLAVNRDSRYGEAGEEFLSYMLSEAVQRQLILKRRVLPWRISALHYGAERFFQMSENAADVMIRQLSPWDTSDVQHFLIYAIQDDLRDFLEQNLDLELVLDQIMLKWEQFSDCSGEREKAI